MFTTKNFIHELPDEIKAIIASDVQMYENMADVQIDFDEIANSRLADILDGDADAIFCGLCTGKYQTILDHYNLYGEIPDLWVDEYDEYYTLDMLEGEYLHMSLCDEVEGKSFDEWLKDITDGNGAMSPVKVERLWGVL